MDIEGIQFYSAACFAIRLEDKLNANADEIWLWLKCIYHTASLADIQHWFGFI